VGEYGSPDDPEDFKTLLAYSPLHNIRKANYPATLITTSDHDDAWCPPQLQIRGNPTGVATRRGSDPDPHRDARRPRRRHPDVEDHRGVCRPLGFLVKVLDFNPKL